MKILNEGNLYNTETGEVKPNRSDELKNIQSKIMNNFWESMKQQNVSPELAKQIAKHTFNYESNV